MIDRHLDPRQHRAERGKFAGVKLIEDARLHFQRLGRDIRIERAPRIAQRQQVRSLIARIGRTNHQPAIGECDGGAADRHLVHARLSPERLLGHPLALGEHRDEPPFRDTQAEQRTVAASDGVRHTVGRDRQPIRQEIVELERLWHGATVRHPDAAGKALTEAAGRCSNR